METTDAAAATDAAWRLHHDEIRDMLERRTFNKHLAEDLAAETFVRMLKFLSVADNDPPRHLRGWLFRIARNLHLDHQKSHATRRELLAYDPHTQFLEHEPGRADEHRFPTETWEEVSVLLANLPAHQRLVVVLRGLQDLSVADTAEIMGISNQAVRTLRHAAKKRLRAEGVSVLSPQAEPPAVTTTPTMPIDHDDQEAI